MRVIVLLSTLLLAIVSSAQNFTTDAMFRGNALHMPHNGKSLGLIYDVPARSFFSSAPIRATPLIDGNQVFFGTGDGHFFSLDKNTGKTIWQFVSRFAINSSAASGSNKVFFSDNEQTLYALEKSNGRLIWKFAFGAKRAYPWRFDYFYSSPTLYKGGVVIGSDDGKLYYLRQTDGHIIWAFNAEEVIRSTAAAYGNTVVVGDMSGVLHALDVKSGREKWRYVTLGNGLKNEDFGFDRRGILSSPVIAGNKIVFGSRDGFLYCIDTTGTLRWKVDHHVSWIISTVAVKDSIVVTGTSDGHFVQAVNLNTGNEIWKRVCTTLFWSSPLIVDNVVYIGGFDGNEFCFDLYSGKRLGKFQTGGIVLSSAVADHKAIYVGSDDGYLYTLRGRAANLIDTSITHRYVFYETGIHVYFQDDADLKIKNYLTSSGYSAINSDTLNALLTKPSGKGVVVVFASDYFPSSILKDGRNALLRRFLDSGGKIILAGMNPLVYEIDEKEKQPVGFNIPAADTILGIKYGENDTRGMGGQFSCFATERGKQNGLPAFWSAILQVDPKQVDIILGNNENGFASSFVKFYQKGGRLVQCWMHPDAPTRLDALLKLSEDLLN